MGEDLTNASYAAMFNDTSQSYVIVAFAVLDGKMMVGYGATREEAVVDLKNKLVCRDLPLFEGLE